MMTTTSTTAFSTAITTFQTSKYRNARSSHYPDCIVNRLSRRRGTVAKTTTIARLSVLDGTVVESQQHQQYHHMQSLLMESVYYKPATEHTQPLFWGGPIDPYLSAGKSIVPSTKALSEMGITTTTTTIVPTTTTTTLGEAMMMSSTTDNKFIIDVTQIQIEDVLPGFARTGGILSTRIDPTVTTASSPPSVVSFVASIDWAANFINVIDHLPIAVLVYVLIEFFLLRPNVNTYKEDIDDDPMGILADTIAVTTVRVTIFCIVAIATVGVFG